MTPATPRERFAWCLFDFANSAFNTVVVTFLYARYFAHELVGEARRGEVLWAVALGATGILVALVAPFLGAIADQSAHKRRFLITASLVCIGATAGLAFVRVPLLAREDAILLALALFAIANIAFEVLFVFYNAFLPGLADPKSVGRLSGRGWAFGYLGGLLCLVCCWPWKQDIPATNLVVAAWFLVFALPMFLRVRDRTPAVAPGQVAAVRGGIGAVFATVRRTADHVDLWRFLLARLFYNDALIALIGLSGLYMGNTLHMSADEVILYAVGLNVVAGIGAFGFGWIDDFLGARLALLLSLMALIAGSLLAVMFPTKEMFALAAGLVGLGFGPNQSASRTLLARLTPPGHEAEFAGLFALSGKSTEWLGTILYGVVLAWTGVQRVALLPLIGLFALGGILLLSVDEKRGIAHAAARGR